MRRTALLLTYLILLLPLMARDDYRYRNLTMDNGVWRYAVKRLKQYLHNEKDPMSLSSDQVNCTLVDERGQLWIGTLDGLCRYDAKGGGFDRIRLEVPSHNIMDIIEDNGVLWLSTERGIVRYEPGADDTKAGDRTLTRQQTQRFTRHDGLVTFSFASLSYCSPEKNQYAYMLEGFDREWNYVGNQNRATYTNLAEGSYVFRVKATNNDGAWSEREAARLNFFTMIAHEIRTPVSLIIGPLERIMKRGSHSDDVRLSCGAEPDGEHFHIVVSDNGAGIREEDRQRIFEPFFQAMDNKPGTGIGLNIVKNIVDLHHGGITVASEVGEGTTFTVVLPVKQEGWEDVSQASSGMSSHKPESVMHNDDEAETSTYRATKERDRNRPVMLIVDDADDMVDFLKDCFKDDYGIITASDGIEALDLLEKHETNIIISDWMMPRMDGAELCRRVRQNALTSHIPFVMLTAKTDDDSKVEGMDVGADAYIEKPFSLEYLEACIRNMLKLRRQLMEKFSTQPLEPVTEIAQNATDNEFLIRMKKIIEDNFPNSELNVNFLADKLNISRSGLFAKIKTLADITPNELIQLMRLQSFLFLEMFPEAVWHQAGRLHEIQ